MPRGRPPGYREVSVDKIKTIVDMTLEKEYTRPEIAKKAGVSPDTVWRYQKKFGLI
jgi:DNA-directed RNA polymerase specialized sigma subunit